MHASAPGSRSTRDDRLVLKALLAGGGLFLLWRMFRAPGTAFWAVFGIAIAIFWSGSWRMLVP